MFYLFFTVFTIYLMRDEIYSIYWSMRSTQAQEREFQRLKDKYNAQGYL